MLTIKAWEPNFMELPVPGRSGVSLDVESYYFYLAFENTLCKDYITEKVQRKHNTVGASSLWPATIYQVTAARRELAPPGELVPQCLSPRSNWDLPFPLPQAGESRTPGPKGGGNDTLACGCGSGRVPILTTGEKPSTLSTLWCKLITPAVPGTVQPVKMD